MISFNATRSGAGDSYSGSFFSGAAGSDGASVSDGGTASDAGTGALSSAGVSGIAASSVGTG